MIRVLYFQRRQYTQAQADVSLVEKCTTKVVRTEVQEALVRFFLALTFA
jgi:hypothetical protein